MATCSVGGAEAFSAIAFQQPHPDTYSFLDQFNSSFQQIIAPAAEQFFNVVGTIYDKVDQSDAARIARAYANRFSALWQPDMIRPLTDLSEFQTAPDTMRRWLMAEPTTRELFHAQRCDGYSNTYTDAQPNAIGEAHYDYRRVTDGMFLEQPNGDLIATTWFDDIEDAADVLPYQDKADIISSWDFQRAHILAKLNDPTSPFNAML